MKYDWQPPIIMPEIKQGELHLWKAHLSYGISAGEEILAEDERIRMHRFRFEKDRMMYLLSHGLLRYILGAYSNQKPEEVKFCYTEHGKPYLNSGGQQKKLEFNLTHSGDIILIAVTRDTPVGVDVEQIRALPDLDQISARFFSRGEQLDLNSLNGPEKVAAFYRCWTRKEAVIKALGEGLSIPLDSFQVSLLPGKPAYLIHSPNQQSWLLLDIAAEPSYTAAVAAPVESLRVLFFSAEGIEII